MRRYALMFGGAGVLVGVLLGGLWSGRAQAQQGAARRWEYLCQPKIDKPWRADQIEIMNGLGARGWELVTNLTNNSDVFCFKRPLY